MGAGLRETAARRLHHVARRTGFEIYPHVAGGRAVPVLIRRLRPPAPLPASFQVAVEETTSFVGFSYRAVGWHPLVQTLEEYATDPDLTYEQSTLARVHERFQPATLQELLLDGVTVDLPPLHRLPALRSLFRYIWSVSPRDLRHPRVATGELRGHDYFGPVTRERGRRQFERLLRAYHSIRSNGFRPSGSHPIRGYFLADDDGRRRFVVGLGNHRVAVLRHLGAETFPASLQLTHPAVVHHRDLDLWTTRRGGVFAPETAEALFSRMLHEDGRAKACRLGLLAGSCTDRKA